MACSFMVRTSSVGSASRIPSRRRGAAVVELAVALPFLVVLVMGIAEVGRAIMVTQTLTNAAREGARRATITGGTDASCTTSVTNYLSNSGLTHVTGATTTVSPSSNNAASGSEISVTVAVPYKKVSWLPGSGTWFKDKTLTATVTMRKK